MLNTKNLQNCQEQHEVYKCGVTKKKRCQYDYRASNGKLFSCIALTLKVAREKRDKWLKEQGLES